MQRGLLTAATGITMMFALQTASAEAYPTDPVSVATGLELAEIHCSRGRPPSGTCRNDIHWRIWKKASRKESSPATTACRNFPSVPRISMPSSVT